MSILLASSKSLRRVACVGFCLVPLVAGSAVTDIANAPLANGLSSNNTVKPNIAFIIDDSGSMNFDDMPNDSEEDTVYSGRTGNRGSRCFGWNKYNTLFYDPTYTYKPPFKIGGAVYSDGVTRYPDASFTAALKDGYFPTGGNTLTGDSNMSTTNTAVNLSTLSNLTPAAVSCVANSTATINLSGSGATTVTQVQVNGVTITSGSASVSGSGNNVSASTMASALAAKITLNGYTATASGSVITITAPNSAGSLSVTPTVTKSGNISFSPNAFTGTVECPANPGKYYYSRHKTSTTSSTCEADSNYTIVTDSSQIVGPTGTGTTAAKTNYANWYSYYRKRGMILKAAVGEAFKDLDESKYRAGLFFINSVDTGVGNINNDYKIADFSGSASGTQRFDWYSKLYSGRVYGGTPLRGALSRVGRMYAGKISGWDPVQYSCQQNFTILSTDGFWNISTETSSYGPKQIDGSSDIGDVDAPIVGQVAATATITVSSDSNSGAVSQITVGGISLMTSATSSSTRSSTVASRIASAVTQNGFSAVVSGNVVTISAPISLGGLTSTPVVTRTSGTSKTYAATAFSGYVAGSTGAGLPYRDSLGQANTLADVSYYYYQTDLRTTALSNCSNTIGSTTYATLCEDNVRGSGKDQNSKQHMTTFTVGLGVSGNILYQSDYETAAAVSGQTTYSNIKDGSANWPSLGSDYGTDTLAKIDDLWHAAVNGRGTYYSASNANTLRAGIQSALSSVQAQTGSSSAAATSSQQPVAGDNFAYVALYRTLKWDGDLQAYAIDPNTGNKTGGVLWSANDQLDAQVAAATSAEGRSIKYFSGGELTKLKDFTYANLAVDGLQANFDNICSKTPLIAQCATSSALNDAQRTIMNTGVNLVNYLRGNATYEDETSNATVANRLYRGREHVLGDIVNSEPVYVKKAPFPYDKYDVTYGTFKTNSATRLATVYTAGNDGMLHAFKAGAASGTDGTEGQERWAYVPRLVMSNMWQLANSAYGDNHRYYVDGSPTLADVCTSLATADAGLCAATSNWKTILVGGLNKGGCGYYALDVTDPSAPKGLWEFTNANLGYSFGKPIVTKNKNGRWIVLIASGYNNYSNNGCGSTGDGNGHLFVLDAVTGDLLDDIPTYTSGTTPAGTPSTPSGLAYLNAWVEDAERPIAKRVYGGDLLGNVWRFDFDLNYGAEKKAYLMATLQDGASTPNRQPITTRPELAAVTASGTTYPVVLVGTGKYLGDTDLSDTRQQSLYGLKDSLASTTLNVRGGTLKSRTFTETTGTTGGALDGRTIRKITGDSLDWSADDGWYMDFNPSNLSPGERINVQMSLDSSILTFAANVPSANACNVGGYAYLYSVDINNGKALANAVDGAAGVKLVGNALVAGIRTITLPSGKKVVLITDTGGGLSSDALPSTGDGIVGTARRTSWREIID